MYGQTLFLRFFLHWKMQRNQINVAIKLPFLKRKRLWSKKYPRIKKIHTINTLQVEEVDVVTVTAHLLWDNWLTNYLAKHLLTSIFTYKYLPIFKFSSSPISFSYFLLSHRSLFLLSSFLLKPITCFRLMTINTFG